MLGPFWPFRFVVLRLDRRFSHQEIVQKKDLAHCMHTNFTYTHSPRGKESQIETEIRLYNGT